MRSTREQSLTSVLRRRIARLSIRETEDGTRAGFAHDAHMTQDGDNVILRKSDEVVVFFGCVLHKVKRGIDLCTTPEKAKKKRG